MHGTTMKKTIILFDTALWLTACYYLCRCLTL